MPENIALGDVDGDGLDDVLIGARNEDRGGEDAGAAYLLLGRGF
ncbi:MAG: FG-GAP repeat protein [Deltaproteobacteria bacterium]|nr:FG-GAP repeat protein [Deltaproteobacteria bacterium]